MWTIFAATAIAAAAFGAASPAAAQPTTPNPTPPPCATARCCDGTWSCSQHGSGTCSHHGGVCQWCPCDSGTRRRLFAYNDCMIIKKIVATSAFAVAAAVVGAPAAGADPIGQGQGGGACTDAQCPPPVHVFMSPDTATNLEQAKAMQEEMQNAQNLLPSP